MIRYVPFLKMKQNEISAICELSEDYQNSIIPFFDIPRPKESNLTEILERIRIGKKQVDVNLKGKIFYLDNFDLDDSIEIGGKFQYESILEIFSEHSVIAVAALNRNPLHNEAAINFAASRNKRIALRLTAEDVESYRISKIELDSIFKICNNLSIFTIDVIIDFRFISRDLFELSKNAVEFIEKLGADQKISAVIICGSSIPASVRDLLKTKEETIVVRKEWSIWNEVLSESDITYRNFIYGYYGVVSPDYTDIELDFRIVQNIAAPKAFYTYDGSYFLIRGGAFKTHPNKYRQYYSMADTIAKMPFFRPAEFSFGERYIFDRSTRSHSPAIKGGSPGSWLKATLVSHMTYVLSTL